MNVTINVVLSPVVILLLVTSSCLILTSQAARPQPSAATAAKTRPQAIQPQTVKHTLKKQKVAEGWFGLRMIIIIMMHLFNRQQTTVDAVEPNAT